MSQIIPPHIHDTMMACSRKLFNAATDGDAIYAHSVMKDVIETINFTLNTWKAGDNGTN